MILQILLIVFGIVPTILVLVLYVVNMYGAVFKSAMHGSDKGDSPFSVPGEVPWKYIGESTIQPVSRPLLLEPLPSDKLVFQTLRVTADKIDKAKWKFRIRFRFSNFLKETIVLDDMHTRVYEESVPTPAYLTISYRGEVQLLQDNTIWKDRQSYSLDRGDGYEMVLVLEMTRREGAPAYGPDHVEEGPVRTVFGLLVDYYFERTPRDNRRTIPSDCVYLFECKSANDWDELKVVDSDKIEELKSRHQADEEMTEVVLRLETLLTKHLAFHPTPKA